MPGTPTSSHHLHSLFPQRDVATFHYRGYPPSTGRPSAKALLDDAVREHDEITAALEPDRIVAVGLSIGSGPGLAVGAATASRLRDPRHPLRFLVALTGDLYPWLPVRLLLRHRMEIAGPLAGTATPVAVIAAGQDEIVPARRTEALRRVIDRLVLDRVVPGASHNDIYDRREYADAMRESLALIEAAPPALDDDR